MNLTGKQKTILSGVIVFTVLLAISLSLIVTGMLEFNATVNHDVCIPQTLIAGYRYTGFCVHLNSSVIIEDYYGDIIIGEQIETSLASFNSYDKNFPVCSKSYTTEIVTTFITDKCITNTGYTLILVGAFLIPLVCVCCVVVCACCTVVILTFEKNPVPSTGCGTPR